MKILVAVKRVVDHNVKVHANADHTGVDIATAKMSMNPFDEVAVEAAVQLKEKAKATEVVAVSIGAAKTVDTLRVALAIGADRAVHVTTEADCEPFAIAKLLARIVESEGADLVIMGKQAIDNDASHVPQMLSALLDWPVSTCIDKIELEGNTVTVKRSTDSGVMTARASLPCVVSADLRLAEPRYVTLPSMMKAKKKPVTVIDAATLGVDLMRRNTLVEAIDPPARAAGVQLESVDALIEKLKSLKAL